jgi:glycosyltransferase involved in cell wall biosynthesis
MDFFGIHAAITVAIKALKKRVGLALGYRSMLRGATLIHALNESELQDIRSFGLTAPCEVIPNGITPPLLTETPPRECLSTVLPQLKDAPYLLFLSRIHPPKGALHLAQAFIELSSAYPELHLVIAGSDFGGTDELIREIKDSELMDRFHLPGFLSGEVKSAALTHAEAFCLPSYHEGFSVAVLESLSWATPTVISTGCHFPEVAEADVGWVHELGSVPLTKALNEVLVDPVSARAKAKRGQSWVADHYHWHAIERLYHDLYQRMTPQDGGRRRV